jgi:hypothetical protein
MCFPADFFNCLRHVAKDIVWVMRGIVTLDSVGNLKEPFLSQLLVALKVCHADDYGHRPALSLNYYRLVLVVGAIQHVTKTISRVLCTHMNSHV